METSMNGWPRHPDPSTIRCFWYQVPDTKIRLRVQEEAAPLLIAAARKWDLYVEPLREGWCWSYNYAIIPGTSLWSNHSSGTAIDLNAPKHPMGVPTSKTLTFQQRRRVVKIAKRYGLRWGGNWSTTPDAMHLEMAISKSQAIALVKRLELPQPKRVRI